MKKRHHLLQVILLVSMVPFIFSCGIPTEDSFCNIKFLGIENKTPTTENTLEFGFRINRSNNAAMDYKKIERGPSLLLFYVLGESTSDVSPSYQNSIKSAIDAKLSEPESKALYFEKGEPFVETNDFKVYPFFVGNDVPLPFNYCYNLDKILINEIDEIFNIDAHSTGASESLKTTVYIEPDNSGLEDSQKGTKFSIQAKKDSISLPSVNISLQDMETPSENYAFIFAVMTPGIGRFKVPSWSNCYYLGSLKLDK